MPTGCVSYAGRRVGRLRRADSLVAGAMMNRGLRALAKLSFLVFLGGCSASHAQTQPPPARTYAVAPAHLGDGPTVHRWSRADRRRLSSALSADFTSPSVDGVVGVSVVADDWSIVYDLRGDHPMTPASTMKLIVGSTALFRLGEGDHLVTSFETLAPPRNDGVVDDLWLVGGGDPVLTTDDLARGVGALRRSGVRLVRNLVLDATRFAGPEQNPAWSPEDDQYDYAAGTSALSLDWDVLKTVVDGAEVYRPVTNIPSRRRRRFQAHEARRDRRRSHSVRERPAGRDDDLGTSLSEHRRLGPSDVPRVRQPHRRAAAPLARRAVGDRDGPGGCEDRTRPLGRARCPPERTADPRRERPRTGG